MARKLLILLVFFLLFSISAKAQSIGLFGGYSFEHLGTSPGRNLNGFEIAAQYKFTNFLRVAADLDTHFGFPTSPDGRTLHFMVGPELAFPARISPFLHVMAGYWKRPRQRAYGHILRGGDRRRSRYAHCAALLLANDPIRRCRHAFFRRAHNTAREFDGSRDPILRSGASGLWGWNSGTRSEVAIRMAALEEMPQAVADKFERVVQLVDPLDFDGKLSCVQIGDQFVTEICGAANAIRDEH